MKKKCQWKNMIFLEKTFIRWSEKPIYQEKACITEGAVRTL